MRRKLKSRRLVLQATLLGISLVVAIGLLFLIDTLLSAFVVVPRVGLVLPPSRRVTYRTPEFVFEAATNSQGFRDREFSAARTAGPRIVALGDSFTYGWGVAAEESWPKLLEANLSTGEMSVEIANLGLPGADPDDYAEIAVRAIPSLRPDLVIVALLQGDDLAQMAAFDSRKCPPHHGRTSLRSRLRDLFPNLTQLVKPKEPPGQFGSAVTSEWQRQVETILSRVSESDRRRFDGLDQRVQQAFRRGELNPAVLEGSLKSPAYFMTTMLVGPERQSLIDNIAVCLARIRGIGEKNGAQVIAAAVPFGAYVTRRDFVTRLLLGFQLDENVLVSKEMDEAIRLAATAAGIPFVAVTEQFRRAPPDPILYFELDGHFTASGHRLFADSLTPAIREALGRARKAVRVLPGDAQRK